MRRLSTLLVVLTILAIASPACPWFYSGGNTGGTFGLTTNYIPRKGAAPLGLVDSALSDNGTTITSDRDNLRLGPADEAAPSAKTITTQNVLTGTANTGGPSLTISGSRGTGTGAGGSVVLEAAPYGGAGVAQNALLPGLTVSGASNVIRVGINTLSPRNGLDIYNTAQVHSDPDVAHGMTDLVGYTDVNARFGIVNASQGGLSVRGLTDGDANAFRLEATSGAADVTAVPIQLRGSKKNLLADQALAPYEPLFGVGNSTSEHMRILGNGTTIHGGTNLGVFTTVTFPTANKDYINETGIGTGLTAVGDLCVVMTGTGATQGLYRVAALISANSIQVDRVIHAAVADIVDGTVECWKDVVTTGVTDGTNGQMVTSWSAQNKPLQLGGSLLGATTGLTGADVWFGNNVGINGLTASQLVSTDANKNLVSTASTGTGAPVRATSPALVTPTLTNCTVDGSASGNLSTANVSNCIIYNTGQALADVELTLPAAAAGYGFIGFIGTTLAATNYWRIIAATSPTPDDFMCLNGTCGKTYISVDTPTMGDTVTCWTGLVSSTGLKTTPALAIGVTNKDLVSSGAFQIDIAGTGYAVGATADGTEPGDDVIVQNKIGCVAFDVGVNGTIDAIEATGQAAAEFTDIPTCIAAFPAVEAAHTRMGYVTATKSDGNFTFGTTALNAANVTSTFVSTAVYTPPLNWICISGKGTWTTN